MTTFDVPLCTHFTSISLKFFLIFVMCLNYTKNNAWLDLKEGGEPPEIPQEHQTAKVEVGGKN